jgi:uncharacterized protein (DUF1501 family)
MKRRTFLKAGTAVAAGAAAATSVLLDNIYAKPSTPLSLLAQINAAENDKILVLVQLFGGNDGLNTVIPALDDRYYQIRPSIAIPKAQCWNSIGDIYLHPALAAGNKQGMAHMLDVGSLVIVQGIGYDHPNLSHFRSTDIWLSGINNSDPNVRLDTGWLGRYLEAKYPNFPNALPPDPLAINFGGFSLALTSDKGRMGIEVENPGQLSGASTTGAETLDTEANGTHYEREYGFIADIANRSNTYAARVKQAYADGKTRLKATYATDSFSQQMASVAALIAGGLDTRVYVVTLGGFDTHVSQQDAANPMGGAQPALLARLADGIAQFQYDLLMMGSVAGTKVADRVVGMTISEFGRRPYENGSLGTDHGAASVQFLFGTQVSSGVYGNPPDLTNFDANGDLRWQIDYRQIYASVLTTWFGMTLTDARAVLNDDALTPVDVIKSQAGGVTSQDPLSQEIALSVSPNPFSTHSRISLVMPSSEWLSLKLVTTDGRVIEQFVDRTLAAGTYEFAIGNSSGAGLPATAGLPAGAYMLMASTPSQRVVRILQRY